MTERLRIEIGKAPSYYVMSKRFGHDRGPTDLRTALLRLFHVADILPEEVDDYQVFRSTASNSVEPIVGVHATRVNGPYTDRPVFVEVKTGAKFSWMPDYPLPDLR